MTSRVVVGGVLAAIVMFSWGFVSHVLLGLGDAGMSGIPQNESAVLTAMADNMPDAGVYYFPWFDHENADEAAWAAYAQRIDEGPSGLIIYKPNGAEAMSPAQLGRQFATCLGLALVAALLLAFAVPGLRCFPGRVAFVTLLGLLPALSVDIPYWNWYGFTCTYTLAQVADHVIEMLLAGLVLAAIIKPKALPQPATS